MVDRIVDGNAEEAPEIPEVLEQVLLYALREAREKLDQGDEVVPFSALVVKDNVFIETHPGDTTDACFLDARHTVEGARGARAYAFCYDGYLELDDGDADALIAEGGLPGASEGYAVGLMYNVNADGSIDFEDEVYYIGPAPNFMEGLKDEVEYAADELNPDYLTEEFEGDFDDEGEEDAD